MSLPGVVVAARGPGLVLYDVKEGPDWSEGDPRFCLMAEGSPDPVDDGMLAEFETMELAIALHPSLSPVAPTTAARLSGGGEVALFALIGGSELLTAALIILHAVDVAGGQQRARDDASIWETPIERRPQISWADLKRLRAACAGEIEDRLRASAGIGKTRFVL